MCGTDFCPMLTKLFAENLVGEYPLGRFQISQRQVCQGAEQVPVELSNAWSLEPHQAAQSDLSANYTDVFSPEVRHNYYCDEISESNLWPKTVRRSLTCVKRQTREVGQMSLGVGEQNFHETTVARMAGSVATMEGPVSIRTLLERMLGRAHAKIDWSDVSSRATEALVERQGNSPHPVIYANGGTQSPFDAANVYHQRLCESSLKAK